MELVKISVICSFAFLSQLSYAIGCDEAKQNIIKTTQAIKLNHQNQQSFDLYKQDEIIAMDTKILKDNNYNSYVRFVKGNCN